MNDAKKFRKFIEATKSVAFWSRELLKVIEKPENKRHPKTEPMHEQQDKGQVDDR